MARIIGGIGTSHVPTIAMAFDKGKQNDPDWKPLFKGYEAVAKWLEEKKPDVLFFCFNDHATSFFFDHYPTFALGVSEEYRIADEGLGQRPIPRLKGHAPMARHIAQSLVVEEFDISVFQDIALDHGLHSPLTMMWPTKPDWPGAVIPLVVNVVQHPLPTPHQMAPGTDPFEHRTGVGLHYHKNMLTPYWDAEGGYSLDMSYQFGLPIFGTEREFHQAYGQFAFVKGMSFLNDWLGEGRITNWLADTRWAWRLRRLKPRSPPS